MQNNRSKVLAPPPHNWEYGMPDESVDDSVSYCYAHYNMSVSPAIFQSWALMYEDKRPELAKKRCKLCKHEAANPSEVTGTPEGNYMGRIVDLSTRRPACESSKKAHMFHYRCAESFIMTNKALFRDTEISRGHSCPGCLKCCDEADPVLFVQRNPYIVKKAKKSKGKPAAVADDDELDFGLEEQVSTGGKKRNREKIEYMVSVHVIQASGLKLKKSDKAVAPVCYVNAFGQNMKTQTANLERTYTYVWDQCFSVKKKMDEEEFSKETISIRLENHSKVWTNDLIGFVKFGAAQVREQKNHEFHRTWTNIIQVGKKDGVSGQGQLQVSVCVYSSKDRENNPKLPIHTYDLETEMWDTANAGFSENVHDGDYLQKAIEGHASMNGDRNSALSSWNIVKLRVYKGEDLPKLKNNKGWCDSFITLNYNGLGFTGKKMLKCGVKKNQRAPEWNCEFRLPMQANVPVFDNRVELRVMSQGGMMSSAKQIGMIPLNLTDILSNTSKKAFWRDIYEDEDGKAPKYRGRVLIDYEIEENVEDMKDLKYSGDAPFIKAEKEPALGSYKLDLEVFEGNLLLGDHSEYQVDIAWGHSMKGDSKTNSSEARSMGGRVWETINGKKSKKNKGVVEFLQKKTLVVHNLPIFQDHVDDDLDDDFDPEEEYVPKTNGIKSYQGMGDHGAAVPFTKNSVTTDYKMQMPDLMIYVSKKGKVDECVGYLRIPISSVKRPTENWEHGEDLTIFPDLWDSDACQPRCLALKPLKELHEKTYGFLTFKACLTRLTRDEATSIGRESPWESLPPVPRQNYRFVAQVYQAKDLASIDESGLSNPFVTVQLADQDLKTKHVAKSCFPLWFEALEAKDMSLPVDLRFAPDILVTVHHHTGRGVMVWRDPSVFMGNSYINCASHADYKKSEPRWYPLEFEEHRYGSICVEFSLTPESRNPKSVDRQAPQTLIRKWPSYAVEVRALALRGLLGSQMKAKMKNPIYELECFGNVHPIDQKNADKKTTIIIKKPTHPVFYSSLNVRVYEQNKEGGKGDLKAVTSIPVDRLLATQMNWYKLIDLCQRNARTMAKAVLSKWKHRMHVPKGQGFKDTITDVYKPPEVIPGDEKDGLDMSDDDDDDVEFSTSLNEDTEVEGDLLGDFKMGKAKKSRKKESKRSEVEEPLLESKADDILIDIPGEADEEDGEATLKARNIDAAGNEIFEEKVIQRMEIPELDVNAFPVDEAEDMWNKTWNTACEYEMLPFVKMPFQEFQLFSGKDEVHQTFLEKLFVASKKDQGMLRGSFHTYPYKKSDAKEDKVKAVKGDFDSNNYKTVKEYLVRCYVTKATQLVSKGGSASKCDPYVTVKLGDHLPFQTKTKSRDINPKFYEKAEFQKVRFPDSETVLEVTVWNDTGRYPKAIGTTKVFLENRLFSKQWNKEFNKSKGLKYRRPVEKRALFAEGSKLPMGSIEICVDIVPQANKSFEPLKYILNPPTRIPWVLRATIFDTRDVTSKNIYQNDEDCCLWQICAPPNQSDVQIRAGLPKGKVGKTDTHSRCIDGEAMFNWRTSHEIELPAPEPLAHFKLQVWNINWSPDDCIAEAVVPLWTWFEYARRDYRSRKHELENCHKDDLTSLQKEFVYHLPKQEVHLTHPYNNDQGHVTVGLTLLPADIAKLPAFRAGDGPEGWVQDKRINAPDNVLQKHKRPDSSFKWYEIHKQIWWRIKYCFKKLWPWFLGIFLVTLSLFIYIWKYDGDDAISDVVDDVDDALDAFSQLSRRLLGVSIE